ncbi:hypothetical protein FC62_GL000830 [Amylolactobacillus amylotrophicus DSM 20534]|uniref:CAAX prenyl protease 2/Lysostaphin resistance protein A-like domain-containing protein n=4 Tax=Amylolactobacillus TaxID=2767876 RepID=A0A0R1YIK3_9LACO|nr:hypothetical protein FC62_GL000830 [Amylolactobacillus amylotrophicus DSM 20534]KRM42320.1 hypothetical protein FD40_GL001107 [Amylolactobacillus amylophilus DSM 20533 = JCM 1125]
MRDDYMNTPRSREGNMVRGTIYLIGYFIIFGARRLAVVDGKVRLWGSILFLLLSLMMLIFYIYRFNRESRYFERSDTTLPISDHFGQLVLITTLIFIVRMVINYIQLAQGIGYTSIQTAYHAGDSAGLFWFFIFSEGIIISTLQQFLTTGFFFNYFFRQNTLIKAIMGVIFSALIFALLNFSSIPLIFISELLIGGLLAWSYLSTQSLWVPVLLAIFNGVLTVVLL